MRDPATPSLDLRAVLLATLLALAAGLPLITTSASRRDDYFFDVTLTSDAAGTTGFFWDSGAGLSERDSSVQPLKIERVPVVYRFMMPAGTYRGFRFAPLDVPAHLTLSHARIVDGHRHLVRAFQLEEFKTGPAFQNLSVSGETLVGDTTGDAAGSFLDLTLLRPVTLPVTAGMRIRAALPWMLATFAIGLILSSPRVLRRTSSPVKRVGAWWAARPRRALALVAALVVAIQAHPVIFFGRSFVSPNNGSLMLYGQHPTLPGATQLHFADTMGSDIGSLLFNHLYYPMVERDALFHDHELPLWNRYSLCGLPLLGQGQSMLGDPFQLLPILADGAAWAWDARLLLAHYLLAAGLGSAVWMLTRHLGASLLTTIGGGFISFFTFRLNHPANFSLGYSPWILVAWCGLIQAGSPRRQLGWLGLLLAANWIEFSSGTVKEATMLMVCLNFAGLLQLWLTPVAVGRRARLLFLAAGTGGIFVLLAAPLWISFLSALAHSVTGYAVPQAQTFSLAQTLGLFDDLFYREVTPEEWVVGPGLNALFLLGVVGWLVTPEAWRRDHAGRTLLLAALLPWAFAFGIVPAALIVKVPFLANIWHVGNTFSCPLLILLAVLAGCGFSQVAAHVRTPGWWRRYASALLLLVGLTVAYLLALRGHSFSLFFQGYASTLAIALIALPLGLRWTARTERSSALLVVLVLGLPLVLWRHAQYRQTPFNHYAFTPGQRSDFHAKSPAVEFLKKSPVASPFRVIGLQNNLFPNYNTLLRWEGLYGADALRNGYYCDLAGSLRLGRVWDWAAGTPDADVPALQRAHEFLNVGSYLADRRKPPFRSPGLTLVAQLDLDVFQSAAAWPRAFFTDQTVDYATLDDFAALVAHSDGRPFAAIQTAERNRPAARSADDTRKVVSAFGYHLSTNTTTFELDAPGPGVAVLTETYSPEDFEVTVDGRSAPYFRVNHAFKGVTIESAGRHRVSFSYWPQYFTFALEAAAVGVAALLAGAAWMWRSGGKKGCIPAAPAT